MDDGKTNISSKAKKANKENVSHGELTRYGFQTGADGSGREGRSWSRV